MNWDMIVEDLEKWLCDNRKEKREAYEWGLENRAWSFCHEANNAAYSFELVLEKLQELKDEHRES